MKLVESLNYRQWQKRNSEHFCLLTTTQKKEIRKQGYFNSGWDRVQRSWLFICNLNNKVTTFFDYKLHKGDLVGALNVAIYEAEISKIFAQEAIQSLEENQTHLNKLADNSLSKYPLL